LNKRVNIIFKQASNSGNLPIVQKTFFLPKSMQHFLKSLGVGCFT